MAGPTPPLKKRKETRRNAITHPQSHPFINVGFRDGMGLRMDNSNFCFLDN